MTIDRLIEQSSHIIDPHGTRSKIDWCDVECGLVCLIDEESGISWHVLLEWLDSVEVSFVGMEHLYAE